MRAVGDGEGRRRIQRRRRSSSLLQKNHSTRLPYQHPHRSLCSSLSLRFFSPHLSQSRQWCVQKKKNTLLPLFDDKFLSKASVFFNEGVKYTADEIRRMEESVRIRRSKEPVELVRLVSGF